MTFGEMLAKQLKGETNYTKEEFAAQAKKQMPSMTSFNGIDTRECEGCYKYPCECLPDDAPCDPE